MLPCPQKGYLKILDKIVEGLDALCFFFDDILPFYQGCCLARISLALNNRFGLAYWGDEVVGKYAEKVVEHRIS